MKIRATTILAIHSEETRRAVVASDGQATLDTTVIKHNTRKIYRLFDDRVIVGFAGATADAMTLFEKLEGKLHEHKRQPDNDERRQIGDVERTASVSVGVRAKKDDVAKPDGRA